METAERLIASCAQGVANACERELEWLVTRQSQASPDSRDAAPSPSLPEVLSALAAGGGGGAAGFARVTYTDAVKALSQVMQHLTHHALMRWTQSRGALTALQRITSSLDSNLSRGRLPPALLKSRPNGGSRFVSSTSA